MVALRALSVTAAMCLIITGQLTKRTCVVYAPDAYGMNYVACGALVRGHPALM